MKKLIIATMLFISTLMFGCAGKSTVVEDQYSYVPGHIVISGQLSTNDMQAFYKQTLDPSIKEYTVVLNTNGGDAPTCIGIMSRIQELQLRGVTFKTVVYSKAYSAGAFIFAMGDERIMYPGAALMWHTMTGQLNADDRYYDDSVQQASNFDLMTQMDGHVIQLMKQLHPQVSDRIWNYLLLDSGMSWMFPEAACDLGLATECK